MIEPDTSGGKILCFTVPSRSQPGVLRHVDLCDDSCDCEDYLWRKSNLRPMNSMPNLDAMTRRCFHINEARLFFQHNVLPAILDCDLLDAAIAGYAKKMGRKFE